ncbi:unknown [Bacteroides sp. CAG:1060]|nr:unknown [Bacteroides sp. CAG:1060]
MNPEPQASFTIPASRGEHTTPSRPASLALDAYFTMVSLIPAPIRSSFCILSSLVDVSWVTAMSRGLVPSSAVRSSIGPCLPFIGYAISIVPAACTLHMSTPSPARTRIAFFTVFGISWSLRSRNTLCPAAFMSRTIWGPSL